MIKEKIRSAVFAEIQKTENRISEYKELSKPTAPDCAIGRISRTDAINNNSINKSVLRKNEEKLKALKYMLSKIDEKDFGSCEKCRQEIPLQSLLYLPQSRFCVKCSQS